MPTKQETFDTVVNHLRHQGRKARSAAGFCRYRTSDGLMCAAGCLMTDEVYSSEFEGFGIVDESKPTQALRALGYDTSFVHQLQVIHDKFRVGMWEGKLALLAEEHGLTYTPPAK